MWHKSTWASPMRTHYEPKYYFDFDVWRSDRINDYWFAHCICIGRFVFIAHGYLMGTKYCSDIGIADIRYHALRAFVGSAFIHSNGGHFTKVWGYRRSIPSNGFMVWSL